MTHPQRPEPQPESYGIPPHQQPPTPRKRKAPAWLFGTALILAGIGGIAGIAAANTGDDSGATFVPASTQIEQAQTRCAPSDAGFVAGDNGRSLTVDGAGLPAGPAVEDLVCVLYELDTPDAVLSRMNSTRALDGMQDASWAGYRAAWTYHPDDGLWMVIEQD